MTASEKAYRLSNMRHERGSDTYLNVFDAQRSLYAAQQGLITIRLAKQANRVRLYAVLGGGADAWPPVPPPRMPERAHHGAESAGADPLIQRKEPAPPCDEPSFQAHPFELTGTRRSRTESLGTLHIDATCFGSKPRQSASNWL